MTPLNKQLHRPVMLDQTHFLHLKASSKCLMMYKAPFSSCTIGIQCQVYKIFDPLVQKAITVQLSSIELEKVRFLLREKFSISIFMNQAVKLDIEVLSPIQSKTHSLDQILQASLSKNYPCITKDQIISIPYIYTFGRLEIPDGRIVSFK